MNKSMRAGEMASSLVLAPAGPGLLARLGQAWLDAEEPARAQTWLARALHCGGDSAGLWGAYAAALDAMGQTQQGMAARLEAMRHLGGALRQRAEPGPAQARVLITCSIHGADLPIDYAFDPARFDWIYCYPAGVHPDVTPDEVDVIFNAVGDPDRAEGDVAAIEALAAFLGRPLLNKPSALAPTRRDRLGATLAGIDNVIVPDCHRIEASALEGFDPAGTPWLIRPIGVHGGDALERITTRAEIAAFAKSQPAAAYYLTRFHDTRSSDGFYRKYRFIFIGGEVHPFHLAIMEQWKVHYWRAGMGVDAWRCAEEEAFMRGRFPAEALDAVRAIAKRLNLDFGGLDCALDHQGRVVVFEANATMLVHLNDPVDYYPYKHELVPKIRDAMSDFFVRRAQAQT